MKTIYILGSLNMDISIKCNRLPKKGETIEGGNLSFCCGGKGLNQAIACAKINKDNKIKFLGCVGEDMFGKQMTSYLKQYNIDTTNINVTPDYASGVALITLHNNDNSIILDLGSNNEISKSNVDVFLNDMQKDDILLTQLENNIDSIQYALNVAKNKGATTILNPAPVKEDINESLHLVDYLIVNEIEYEQLNCNSNKNIIITLGDKGYKYISENIVIENSCKKVEVVDTTGAGDTFVGCFTSLICDNQVNKKLLDKCCLAATISVTKKGSSISSPTLEELESF